MRFAFPLAVATYKWRQCFLCDAMWEHVGLIGCHIDWNDLFVHLFVHTQLPHQMSTPTMTLKPTPTQKGQLQYSHLLALLSCGSDLSNYIW